ncbi:hypothetical protein FHX74_000872 [Friedmanniella endophytica]|uniref:Bacterial Ig domain-containing protein n=1 Tax=Microlunatus kandeliicorticis TaxID=1759536 RepID=A0A7W3IQA9_9ACTN|nr:Ig-like domain-containing protein [Microlunatus kandeliicorticis]MBA8793278.1 hypothetical protein [Microlunatus kandeliicorticis]
MLLTAVVLVLMVPPPTAHALPPYPPPAAPVIGSPFAGAVTGADLQVAGSGEERSTATIRVDGIAQPPVTVDYAGWTERITGLSAGPHTLSVALTGGTSATTTTSFTVDPAAPAAPVITAPAEQSTTNASTLTATGTGTDGATVRLFADGVAVGSAPVTAGHWSVRWTSAKVDGVHVLSADQTLAGVRSRAAAPVRFWTDNTPPIGFGVLEPGDGEVLTDATPRLTLWQYDGTATSGTLYVDGRVARTFAWAADDYTSLQLTTPLSQGPHTLAVSAADQVGNVAPRSWPKRVLVASVVTDRPVITTPFVPQAVVDPVVTGTGKPGGHLTLQVDHHAPWHLTIGASRHWSQRLGVQSEGTHTVTATIAGVTGRATRRFVVDLTPPAPPTVTAPADGTRSPGGWVTLEGRGEPGDQLGVGDRFSTLVGADNIQVGADGRWSSRARFGPGVHALVAYVRDAAGNRSSVGIGPVFVTDGSAPPATRPTDPPTVVWPVAGSRVRAVPAVAGTGSPGATVTARLADRTALGQATVGADGRWVLTLGHPLSAGQHTVYARQSSGAVSSPERRDLFVVDSSIGRPTITSPPDGRHTTDRTPTVRGRGEPGARVGLARDGAGVGKPAVVRADGSWSITLPTQPYGRAVLTASVSDAADNVTRPSAPVTLTITH